MKTAALALCSVAMLWAQAGRPAPPPSKQYLKVQQYSAEEDSRVLKLYDGLRVCDVMDALDVVGLQDITMMDRNIRPLWRDEQKFTHRIHGVALTVRLVPAQERAPHFNSHADERPWEAAWYKNQSEYAGLVRPGTILVVDNQARDDGFCGSNMGLSLFGLGLRGFVGNEVCRDTDEMTLSRIPVYQDPALSPRGINPGRMWVESYNEPITVGHVLVMPGDIIVADNDGVAVVPRAKADQVAEVGRWIFEDDEVKRGKIYDRVGKPRDWTVEGHTKPPPPSNKVIH
jgi:regulator of RNase E activity RraA